MKSKVITVLFSLLIMFSLVISVNAQEIANGKQAAKFLKQKNLLQGDDNGNLMLDKPLKREEMMVVISRLLGVENTAKNYPLDNMTFKDVPKWHWAASYTAWAQAENITQGYSSHKFGLGDPLTLWQTKAFFVNTLGYTNLKYEEYNRKAKELEITKEITFENKSSITRCKMAHLMYNTLHSKCKDGKVIGQKIGVIDNNKSVNRERGNTVGNIVNMGKVAKQGDWIYYSIRVDDYNNVFYKKNIKSGKKIKLTNKAAWNINVIDEWIYYSTNDGFYKMKLDGTEETKLISGNVYNVSVVGEWIYYSGYRFSSEKCGIYKMLIDGTQKQKICDDWGECANVVGNWIYYVHTDSNNQKDYYNLYKIKTDGSKKTKISDHFCRYVNVVGDWIYYYNLTHDDLGGLYKIKTDGTKRTKVSDKICRHINISEDWIYYSGTSKQSLYKMKMDGTQNTKLSDEKCSWINVVGDWIFYEQDVGTFNDIKVYKIKKDGTNKTRIQ